MTQHETNYSNTGRSYVGPVTTQNLVVKFDGEICGGNAWWKMLLTISSSKRSSKISFQTSPEVHHQFRRRLRQLHSGNRWCSHMVASKRERKTENPQGSRHSLIVSLAASSKKADGCDRNADLSLRLAWTALASGLSGQWLEAGAWWCCTMGCRMPKRGQCCALSCPSCDSVTGLTKDLIL